jgi:hypothetical protein
MMQNMKLNPKTRKYPCQSLFAVLLITVSGWGCATSGDKLLTGEHTGKSSQEIAREALKDSTVDISYVLGHSRRRLVAWARNDSFGGQTLMDHQILRETEIDRRLYSEFFSKAEQFVSAPRRKPAEQNPSDEKDSCRTPFTVKVRIGAETQTLQGCRGEDDGALSHLVRDGEFLLYSKK